jgi:hypothetical protein
MSKEIYRLGYLFAILLSVTSPSAWPDTSAQDIVPVPTVTRLVKLFTQLEYDLITSLKKNDKSMLSRLVDDRFEMQVASQSREPVPMSAWLEKSLAESSLYHYEISNMSVYDYGGNAIVSFNWQPFAPIKDNSVSPGLFIVDVWKKDGPGWKLAIRFAEGLQKSGERFPGFVPTDGVIEKKY